MKKIKNFFSITENTYKFEFGNISTILTVVNVAMVLGGLWYAPIVGIINCILSLVLNVKYHSHINMYVMQIALVILNICFLTL